jgi:WD40 repeat protein
MSKELRTTLVPGRGIEWVPPTAFHASGDWLATTGLRRRCLSRIDCATAHVQDLAQLTGEPFAIAFSASGETLLVVEDGSLSLWDIRPNEADCRFRRRTSGEVPEDGGVPVLFTEQHAFWLFYSDEWSLWSMLEHEKVASFAIASGERLLRIAHNTSGEAIAITYDEEPANHSLPTLSRINLRSGEVLGEVCLVEWHYILVSPDGCLAAMQARSSKWEVHIWDLVTCTHLHTIGGITLGTHPCFAADNRHIVTHPIEGHTVPWTWIEVTDVITQDRMVFDSLAPFRPVLSCSPLANVLVAIANDGRHRFDRTWVWSVSPHKLLGQTSGHVALGKCLFSPCGRWLATVSNAAGEELAVNPQPGGSVRINSLNSLTCDG